MITIVLLILADEERPMKNNHQRLGSAGLALHHANIITQIDTLVIRSGSVPPNTRDGLYHGLPPNIKSALRFKVLSFSLKEEDDVSCHTNQAYFGNFSYFVFEEWLDSFRPFPLSGMVKGSIVTRKGSQVGVAVERGTARVHHGFGWVGEWANTGSEINRKPTSQVDLLRIETLYHADKEKTEAYILELAVWLHYLVSQSRSAANGGVRSPIRSPNQKTIQLSNHKPSPPSSPLSVEDQEMLRDISKRKLIPGISKSQEFAKTGLSKCHRLSKSSSHSPINETRKDPFPIRRQSSVPVFDFDIDRMKALDVIDRVDSIKGA
ncbi:hypothetical protein RND71_028190 [Anisodus tanguticus]|uniref:DUF668 domain-containing protein n=1 Tax=Anisodus tanguticus TaxID=243964 RepID=A0AAE1V2F6_9SOLA|nr:hypothetical protein RND71_028190 [Anisodus tanguticus]